MWRFILPFWAMLLTASSSPMPDATGVGHEIHGMTESQTALYLMAVLIIALLVERGVTGWRTAATTNRLATAIDGLRASIVASDAQSMAHAMLQQYEFNEAKQDRAKLREAVTQK